jgi:hypothetical protein
LLLVDKAEDKEGSMGRIQVAGLRLGREELHRIEAGRWAHFAHADEGTNKTKLNAPPPWELNSRDHLLGLVCVSVHPLQSPYPQETPCLKSSTRKKWRGERRILLVKTRHLLEWRTIDLPTALIQSSFSYASEETTGTFASG